MAPFWGDVDARMDGDIFYEVHEAGLTDTSDAYLSEVSAFISRTSSVDFQASRHHVVYLNSGSPEIPSRFISSYAVSKKV